MKTFLIFFRAPLLLIAALLLYGGPYPATARNLNGGGTNGIEHVRVVWMKNPSREAVVSWSTRAPGKKHSVFYDEGARGGVLTAYKHRQKTFRDGQFTTVEEDEGLTVPTYYHHAHLSNLKPATTYYLVIVSDNNVSREYHFVTAPEGDEPIAILQGGDSRMGRSLTPADTTEASQHTDRQKMNLRIAALVEEHPEIVAFAHGGDYCIRAELRYIDRWLHDAELTTTRDGRLVPIIPTRGNHDSAIGFEEMFAWPDLDTRYYYATRLSAAVSLITLNTEASMGGDQRNWLARTLDDLRPESDWICVQYHRPAYTSVKNPQRSANQRQYWVPLFEEYNVNLVCESDDHALKRTLPIRDGKPDLEDGITYVGDGGLGVPQRTPDPTRWWLQKPGFARSAHHVFMVEFRPDKMRVSAIGMEGDVIEQFELEPKGVLVK